MQREPRAYLADILETCDGIAWIPLGVGAEQRAHL
jgi:hypothetical protein